MGVSFDTMVGIGPNAGSNKVGLWRAFDMMVHEKFEPITLMDRHILMWCFLKPKSVRAWTCREAFTHLMTLDF